MGLGQGKNLLLSTIAILCFGPTLAADEFHQFSGVYGYGGYAQTPIGPTTKVRVYPRLYGYNWDHPIVVKKDNTVNVPFFFDVSTPALELVREVVVKVLNQPNADTYGYGVDVMPISEVSVALEVNGEDVASSEIKGYVTSPSGIVKGQVHYDGRETEVIEAVIAGDYVLKASFSFPLSTFSGLYLDVTERNLSEYKAEAFKRTVANSKRKSGGFLFWKYSNEVVTESVSKRLVESRESSFSRQMNLVLVDPTPAMEEELSRLLGFEEIEKENLLSAHETAAAKAEARSGKIGRLHRAYSAAVKSGNVSDQLKTLSEVALFPNSQILGFMSAGLAFDGGTSSRSQVYLSSVAVSGISDYHNRLNQTIIRNANVRGTVRAGPFAKEAQQMNYALLRAAFPGIYATPYGAKRDGLSTIALNDTIVKNDMNLFWRMLVCYPQSITWLWDGSEESHPTMELAVESKRKHMAQILKDKGLSAKEVD